ncbi:MAG: ABC transporter permease [Acidobacteria bacterium]|nr:ABC transporter permease [Acidobacteriota bacterium]
MKEGTISLGETSFPKPQTAFTQFGELVTGFLSSFFEWFGELGIFCGRLVRAALTRPYEGRELIRQLDEVGSKSLLLVSLAGAAIGVVLPLETSESLTRFGARSMLPTVIIISIIREMGPIITGLIVCGRVGAGIGAELGSMNVTEQIDAMEASAVNPYRFLVATRADSSSGFLGHRHGLGCQYAQ